MVSLAALALWCELTVRRLEGCSCCSSQWDALGDAADCPWLHPCGLRPCLQHLSGSACWTGTRRRVRRAELRVRSGVARALAEMRAFSEDDGEDTELQEAEPPLAVQPVRAVRVEWFSAPPSTPQPPSSPSSSISCIHPFIN